ncbi:hypothetical protein M404DRAFT_558322 [Pisolithus tinctorius Marx 270]|uniref:Uncharacterized protein n=1 Tax=Pisolithus tinctorius Marx 270 TaxID=870435 RepID=A0A0C3J5F7_PISTI|nr:hypothetical protein M404DRAFT_558322 [Pisolithus tinctorius Marx 270]
MYLPNICSPTFRANNASSSRSDSYAMPCCIAPHSRTRECLFSTWPSFRVEVNNRNHKTSPKWTYRSFRCGTEHARAGYLRLSGTLPTPTMDG